MRRKKEVIERLQMLQRQTNLSTQEFKRTLASITGKTPRTLRRWFALENDIQDSDLRKIASHFGHHENWLKYGDDQQEPIFDQIMSSNHFGAVVMKNNEAERMNHKFIEMMNLIPEEFHEGGICEYILSFQPDETVELCHIASQLAEQRGAHHLTMIMILGDRKQHSVELTSLKLNNDRILTIIVDKGLVS